MTVAPILELRVPAQVTSQVVVGLQPMPLDWCLSQWVLARPPAQSSTATLRSGPMGRFQKPAAHTSGPSTPGREGLCLFGQWQVQRRASGVGGQPREEKRGKLTATLPPPSASRPPLLTTHPATNMRFFFRQTLCT